MLNVKSHKIMEMERQKREKIINAAMEEFKGGYKKASTDAIVRQAGISKGLLFYYFGSKEKLYEFLLRYAVDRIADDFVDLINFKEPDLLERIWQMTLLKRDLSFKHPALFDFITAAYVHEAKDNPTGSIMIMLNKLRSLYTPQVLGDIDKSLFKDNLDVARAVNTIWWTLSSYSYSQVDTGKSMDEHRDKYEGYLTDLKGYFDMFREVFYK